MKYAIIFLVIGLAFLGGGVAHRLATESGWLPLSERHPADGLVEEDGHEAVPDHDDEHDEHISLSAQAVANLQLVVAPIERSDYEQVLRIPGEVVEQPGHSAHVLAAPVNGIVERILALPGMAISPGQPLFELQVVDEQVFAAQLDLLESATRLEIIDAELERLAPLATSGTIAGRAKLDLEYEKKQQQSTRELRIQELLARGLEQAHVDRLLATRQLLRTIVVKAPDQATHTDAHGLADIGAATDRLSSPSSDRPTPSGGAEGEQWTFTVESLLISPGQTVHRGEGLCDLAHHAELYVQGHVFESEIDAVLRTAENGWPLSVEFGIADQLFRRSGLEIRYVANHVDPTTQTFLFYAPLRNEVLSETYDAGGRRFRSWRFKVGQRVDVLTPVERFEDCLKLPAEAVVQEGPDVLVFRECEHHEPDETHDEHEVHAFVEPTNQESTDQESTDEDMDHEEHDEADADHDEAERDSHEQFAIELEPVPVAVKYRDRDFVVLQDDGQIQPGDVLAMNAAYQLLLAIRAQSEQGVAHAHHDH